MTPEDVVRDVQFFTERAHFVFKEKPQRLDQLQTHTFRQTADVVMCLDRCGRSFNGNRFDDVGIERALNQKIHRPDLLGFFLEHGDEFRRR